MAAAFGKDAVSEWCDCDHGIAFEKNLQNLKSQKSQIYQM